MFSMQEEIHHSDVSCSKHMSQLRFNFSEHAELNDLNVKQHDTEIEVKEQSEQETAFPPFNLRGSQSNSLQLAETHKIKDEDQKSTLAKLRINRIKGKSQAQKEIIRKKSISRVSETEQQQTPFKNPHKMLLALNLLVSVKNFYRQVTKNTRILQRLTLHQHDVIGDVTSVYNAKKNTKGNKFFSFLSILVQIIQQYLGIIPAINPYSNWKRFWDFLNTIFIISLTFFISLQLFFTLSHEEFSLLRNISFYFFIIDIFVNFNTSIVMRGQLIDDRKIISVLYLKKKFILDLIGISPFILNIFNHKLLEYFSFLFLIKWVSMQQTFERFTFYLNYQKNLKNVVDLVKLILLLCIICHIFCGFWHILAVYEMSNGSSHTWLHLFELENGSIFNRYVCSFYYLAVTMITVGYGDITPQNTNEIIFTILTMFVTGITWGFSINKIGNIIDNIEKKDKTYRESMQVIHTLMREERIASDLRDQISNYLKYLFHESNEVQKKQEERVIQKLSNSLRQELIQNIQGQYLQNIPFINNMESKKKIILLMKECLYSPGEIIFKENNNDDCFLYYLVKGEVEIINLSKDKNRSDSKIKILGKGSYFGEISFVTGFPRSHTARAIDFCRVYKIDRSEFVSLISKNDHDIEKFQMMKEGLIFKNNYSIINKKCYLCLSDEHMCDFCPKTHLVISTRGIANRFSFSIPHTKRSEYERNHNRFWKTLLFRERAFQAVYQINENEDLYDILNDIEQISKIIKKNSSEVKFQSQQSQESSEDTSSDDDDDNTSNNSIEDDNFFEKIQNRPEKRRSLNKMIIFQIRNCQENNIFEQESSQNILEKKINTQDLNEISLSTEMKQNEIPIISTGIQLDEQENSIIQKQRENNNKKAYFQYQHSSNLIQSHVRIPEVLYQSSELISAGKIKNTPINKSIRKKKKSQTVCTQKINPISFNQDFKKQPQNNQVSLKLIQSNKENHQESYELKSVNTKIQQILNLIQNMNIQISKKESVQNDRELKKKKTKFVRTISKIEDIKEPLSKISSKKNNDSPLPSDYNTTLYPKNEGQSSLQQKKLYRSSVFEKNSNKNILQQKSIINPSKGFLYKSTQDSLKLIDNNLFMLQNLDRASIFKFYYPKFNYTIIVKKLKKIQNTCHELTSFRKQNSICLNAKSKKSRFQHL